jgi:hypothetical protein
MTRGELARALLYGAAGAFVTLVLVAAAAFPEQATGVGTVALVLVGLTFEGARLWRGLRR